MIMHPLIYFSDNVWLGLILYSKMLWQDSRGFGSPDRHVGQSDHVGWTGNAEFETGLHGRLVETRESFPGMRRFELRGSHPSVITEYQHEKRPSFYVKWL